MKHLIVLFLSIVFSISVANAQNNDDIKQERLNQHLAVIKNGVRTINIPVKFEGVRDYHNNNDIAKAVFELRYGFLDKEQEKEFWKFVEKNGGINEWESNMVSIFGMEINDDWSIGDEDITTQYSKTRDMVYRFTTSARKYFKDNNIPAYVVGFQPISVEYERFTITDPNLYPDEKLISDY